MKLPRRRFLHLAAAAVALPAVSHIARAQTYPTRPVRIIVGFPPGGVTDLYARLLARSLSERFRQQFFVDNRTGAGGNIAAESVVRATPDGYTLLMTTATDPWNTALYDHLNFDYVRDITPVAGVTRFECALVLSPSFPATTASGFIAYVKANPGKLTIASGGVGSIPHISWELFKSMAKLDMVHIPYRGEAPALLDLISGQVQVMMPTIPSSIEYIRTGKLRALAVTGALSSVALPEVPTLGDFVPGYELSAWAGIGAPKNAPVEIIDRLNSEINVALADPKIIARIVEQSASPFPTSPAEFAKFVVEFADKWARIIKTANIKAE
jgi:tripartite-type tricarboxylate transporter receptor subunit TctC